MTIQEFVEKNGITIQSIRTKERPDGHKEWKAFHYSVVLTRGDKTLSTVYSMGFGHVKRGKAPAGVWAGGDATTKNGVKVWRGTLSGQLIEGHPKLPTAQDVLDSLRLDAEAAHGTFEDFCADMGYSTDSRKALEMYLECQNTGTRLRVFLGEIYAEFLTCDPL